MTWRWTAPAWFIAIGIAVLLSWVVLLVLWAYDGLRDSRKAQVAFAGLLVASGIFVYHASTVRSWCSPQQFSGEFQTIEMKQPTLWDCFWLTRVE